MSELEQVAKAILLKTTAIAERAIDQVWRDLPDTWPEEDRGYTAMVTDSDKNELLAAARAAIIALKLPMDPPDDHREIINAYLDSILEGKR